MVTEISKMNNIYDIVKVKLGGLRKFKELTFNELHIHLNGFLKNDNEVQFVVVAKILDKKYYGGKLSSIELQDKTSKIGIVHLNTDQSFSMDLYGHSV
jgi:hypothetical protein